MYFGNYLRQGGYVFIGVSLLVSRITQTTQPIFTKFSEKLTHGPATKETDRF